MTQYYYLLSSLPSLLFDSDITLDSASFLSYAKDWLGEEAYTLLESAKLVPLKDYEASYGLLKQWYSWECGLRNDLAKARAAKNHTDPELHVRKDSDGQTYFSESSAFELIRQALANQNPKDAEFLLLKGRWDFLESLELGHYFDLDKVLIYYLKLQLAERKKTLDLANGKLRYKEQYEAINASFPLNLND